MKKVVYTLCLQFLLAIMPAAAQTGSASATEPIPDGERNPALIATENSVLDAVLLIDAGRRVEAVEILDSLDRTCPPDAAVQYYLGFLAATPQSAVERFEKAVALDSSNVWYREALANTYVSAGEAAKAGGILSELAGLKPAKFRNAYTMTLIAEAYRLKRDFPSFFGTLTDLVKDENITDEIKYQALMGVLGGFDSRTFNAILPQMDTLMLRYTEAEPKSIHAHSLHMEMAAYGKRHQTVIDECRRLIELQPSDTTAIVTSLSIIGDTYHEMGEVRKAYKTYDSALKLDPRHCPVLNNYAYFLSLEKKRLCKAERMSRITIEQEPDNPTYLDTYGWILYLRGKAAKAKPYFKHAMIYGGKDSAVVLMHYSLVLKALGENELAAYYKTLAENKSQ